MCRGDEARRQGDVSSFIAKALWLLFVVFIFFLFFWIALLFSLSFLAGVVIHRNWGYAHSPSCFTWQCFASATLNSGSLPFSLPNISFLNTRQLCVACSQNIIFLIGDWSACTDWIYHLTAIDSTPVSLSGWNSYASNFATKDCGTYNTYLCTFPPAVFTYSIKNIGLHGNYRILEFANFSFFLPQPLSIVQLRRWYWMTCAFCYCLVNEPRASSDVIDTPIT